MRRGLLLLTMAAALFLAAMFLSDGKLAVMSRALWDQPDHEPSVQTEEKTKTVTMGAVGDIMLARKVDRLCQVYGYDYPLLRMGERLRVFDLTFCNLESPISTQGQPMPGKGITFRAPPDAVETLLDGGFDVVSFANNHALDYRDEAFRETLSILAREGMEPVGAGDNLAQARQAAVLERNGIKVAFLAYSDMADIYFSSQYKREFSAGETRCGVAPLQREMILEDVAAVRPQADIVVVSLHWGVEYSSEPTYQQRLLAHEIIDSGADLIIGHHPHVFQGLEAYGQGLIAYSLGNFIFDQNQRQSTCQGLLLETVLGKDGLVSARVRPVFIDESQPGEPDARSKAEMLSLLKGYCDDLGTASRVNGGYLEVVLLQSAEKDS